MSNPQVRALLATAAAGSDRNPAVRFKEVGDGFKHATITSVAIKEIASRDPGKPAVTTLILGLELPTERSQPTKVVNEVTGFLEPGVVSGKLWTLFINANSQPLTELSRAIRDGGGNADSPQPGDQLDIDLVGQRPMEKGNPQNVFAYTFVPGIGGELPLSNQLPASIEAFDDEEAF